MASASVRIVIIFIAALIGYAVRGDEEYSYTSLVKRICNGKIYPIFSQNENAPGVITGLIAKETPDNANYEVYDNVTNTDYILYGYGFCSRDLGRDKCATCMNSARDQLFVECSMHSVGAQIQLQGCKLRYEEYYFDGSQS